MLGYHLTSFAYDLYDARFDVMNCLDELMPKFVTRVCERLLNDGKVEQWIIRLVLIYNQDLVTSLISFSGLLMYGSAVESPKRPVGKRAHTVSHNMTTAHNKGS